MPTAPIPLENRHLAVSNLCRNDSLKSERSDKKVSFNTDADVKYIPRGSNKPPAPLPPPLKAKLDEWSRCKPVKLQHNTLSNAELQKEADNLADLVDSINCKASPLPLRKNKEYSSRSLDRSHKRNNLDNDKSRNGLHYTQVTNPLIRHLKADLNRTENNTSSGYSDSDSDRQRRNKYKSTPNLVTASYNNVPNGFKQFTTPVRPVNYSSVDNLLDKNNVNYCDNNLTPSKTVRQSGEPLLHYPQPKNNFGQYKSLGNLPREPDSDSSESSYKKKPKVDELIKRLNHKNTGPYNNGSLSSDRDSSTPRKISSTSKSSQDSHKFSSNHNRNLYKDNNFIAKNQSKTEDMYAQVNKSGLRQRLSLDSDYSAKIIITEDKSPQSYMGDEDAYETYQVTNNIVRGANNKDYGVNLSNNRSKFRDDDNVNMNRSSVAVQTDTFRKALSKDRKSPKAMAPQPPVQRFPTESYRSKKDLNTGLPSANLVRQVNHGFGRYDKSPSPPPRRSHFQSTKPHVVPLLSDTSDSEPEYRKRTDPLAKIRNQVLSNERLPEDQDNEEFEGRKMHALSKSTQELNFNQRGMRPITIQEVDKVSLDLDQPIRRNFSDSNSKIEQRSSNHQTYENSHTKQIPIQLPVENERSRHLRPLREKSFVARDSSASREEEPATPPKNPSVEKDKENEKKGGTFRFKGKDKKNKDTLKDKKKKRIKIKFFYDPRPQDKPTEDPLKSFTEYTGKDSSKQNEAKITMNPKSIPIKTRTNRSPSIEKPIVRDIVRGRESSRDRSRENSRDRLRDTSRESSRERALTRPANTRDFPRVSINPPSSADGSSEDRRRVRSTDRSDRRTEYSTERNEQRNGNRFSYDLDPKSRPNKYQDSYQNERRNSNGNSRSRYDLNSDHETGRLQDEPIQRRSTFLERREAYERRDGSNHDGSVPPRQEYPSRSNFLKNDTPSRYARYNLDSQEEERRNKEANLRDQRNTGEKMTINTASRTPAASTLRKNTRYQDESPPPILRSQKPPLRSNEQHSPDRQLNDRSRQRVQHITNNQRETRHWESNTPPRPSGPSVTRTLDTRGDNRRNYGNSRRNFSEESSASSGGEQRMGGRRKGGYSQKYSHDSDYDQGTKSGPGDYRSLPVRAHRTSNARLRAANAGIGSAGSSLQSSESENDSHNGSKASHVSTGSNRSVYLHATAVADIPVTDGDSTTGAKRQARKVTRSFSLVAPWRPRRPSRDALAHQDQEGEGRKAAAKPPRPPKRSVEAPVGRSHTLTQKDNKLSGWLRKRKVKEGKGI